MINEVKYIAKKAGATVKEGFQKKIQIDLKTNESNLVTEIDKKSEQEIIGFIKRNFPDHGIIAEESGMENNKAEYVWVIDPLDGTTNFAHGLPIFSVSIGLQKNGETIAGAVYDVMRDAMYWAEKGKGSFVNDKQLHVSENGNLRRSCLVTGFPYDVAEHPKPILKIFGDMIVSSRAVRRLGSAAIDFCYVAEGVFDGYWETFLYPWDMCAGKLIVEEAGGVVTDFKGNKTGPDGFLNQILATNGQIHERMIEIINSK